MPETHEPAGMGLAEAIREVRLELQQAMQEGQGSGIGFEAGQVELEFEVGLTRSREASGGFQLSVLSLGAKGDRTSTATHRVNIVLTPISRDQVNGGDDSEAESDDDEVADRPKKRPVIVIR